MRRPGAAIVWGAVAVLAAASPAEPGAPAGSPPSANRAPGAAAEASPGAEAEAAPEPAADAAQGAAADAASEAAGDSALLWLGETLPCIRTSTWLRVTLHDGTLYQGRYVAYVQDSLWVAGDQGRALFGLRSLEQVSVRSTRVREGVGLGIAIGGMTGFGLSSMPGFFDPARPLLMCLAGSVAGAYAGGFIGSRSERWDPLVPQPGREAAHRRALATVPECIEAPLQAGSDLATAVALLQAGQHLRLELDADTQVQGRFVRFEAGRLTVSHPEFEETLAAESIRRMWVQRRGTRRGAAAGAILFAIPAAALFFGAARVAYALCEHCDDPRFEDYVGPTLFGAGLGAGAGLLVGSGVGSIVVYDHLVYARAGP